MLTESFNRTVHNAKPFLRWAGGKRWLAKAISPIIRQRLVGGSTYYEPFLGSGAIFFEVQPAKAVLSDLNEDLMITYNEIKSDVVRLIRGLQALPANKEKYYEIRSWIPKTDFEKALRLIYLNRNCFGGIYRENKKGNFNVPYGGGDRNHFGICENGTLSNAAKALNPLSVKIDCCDFEKTIAQAEEGDVIYCDPTYKEVSRKTFDRYGKMVFAWKDQIRLKDACTEAYKKGALIIISNSTCHEVENLYKDFQILKALRKKGLGRNYSKAQQSEYLIIMDPVKENKIWEEIFFS